VLLLAVLACGGGRDRFPEGSHLVTVRVDGPGRLLSLPPAIDCPGTCSALFANGSWVTIAATSEDGVSFTEWSRGCSGATGCGFAVAGDTEVVAHFERAQKK
jgi:hypothetical protein